MKIASRTDLEMFGKMGEAWVARELRRRGYAVELIGESSDYAILLEGVARVEVKSALLSNGRGRRVRWQFSLRRRGNDVDEDLLFLLCYKDLDSDPVAVFVIPGRALSAKLSKIDVTSRDPRRYRGKWARFRDAWLEVQRVVDDLPARQPALFRRRVEEPVPF